MSAITDGYCFSPWFHTNDQLYSRLPIHVLGLLTRTAHSGGEDLYKGTAIFCQLQGRALIDVNVNQAQRTS